MVVERYSFKDLELASYITLMDSSTKTTNKTYHEICKNTYHYAVFKEGTSLRLPYRRSIYVFYNKTIQNVWAIDFNIRYISFYGVIVTG